MSKTPSVTSHKHSGMMAHLLAAEADVVVGAHEHQLAPVSLHA
jgi:hypothetical protein